MPIRNIHNEVVDISKHPQILTTTPLETQTTIGDLHGNVMKLIFALINAKFIKLSDDTEEQQFLYDRLWSIYMESYHLTYEQYIEFKLIIEHSIISQSITSFSFENPYVFRLLGDDIGDRGYNDVLTLFVIKFISTHPELSEKLKLIILFSNHSQSAMIVYELLFVSETTEEFFENIFRNINNLENDINEGAALPVGEAYRKYLKEEMRQSIYYKYGNILTYMGGQNLNTIDFSGQCASMHGLLNFLYLAQEEYRQTLFLEIKQMYTQYKRHLKLIDYSIGDDSTLFVYTHAPVNSIDILNLVNDLRRRFFRGKSLDRTFPNSVRARVSLLDEINLSLAEHLCVSEETSAFNFLVGLENYCVKPNEYSQYAFTAPFRKFAWQRARDLRQENHTPKGVYFVHGHEGYPSNFENGLLYRMSFDSCIGRGPTLRATATYNDNFPILGAIGEFSAYDIFLVHVGHTLTIRQEEKDSHTQDMTVLRRLPRRLATRRSPGSTDSMKTEDHQHIDNKNLDGCRMN